MKKFMTALLISASFQAFSATEILVSNSRTKGGGVVYGNVLRALDNFAPSDYTTLIQVHKPVYNDKGRMFFCVHLVRSADNANFVSMLERISGYLKYRVVRDCSTYLK